MDICWLSTFCFLKISWEYVAVVVEIHYYRMATSNFDWTDFESHNFLDIEIKGDIRSKIDQNTLIKLPMELCIHFYPF